jgi:transposase
MNKRDDARKLKPAAQQLLRRQVVNAVRAGMKQVHAARVFRASLRAVNKWVALDKLGGLRALKAKRRGRRTGEGALNDKQAARIYQLILGKMPDQLKLPFYLWTRAAVAQLIEREFAIGVRLAVAANLPAGVLVVPAHLRYQACDANLCYAPATVDTQWTLKIVPAAAPGDRDDQSTRHAVCDQKTEHIEGRVACEIGERCYDHTFGIQPRVSTSPKHEHCSGRQNHRGDDDLLMISLSL